MSHALDGTYDDDDDAMLWDGSEEDWNVSCGCEEDEGTTVNGDSDTDW
jgi:hypothetical protein